MMAKRYEYAKGKITDWKRKAADDLKVSIKVYILGKYLVKTDPDIIFRKVRFEIAEYLKIFEDDESELRIEYENELTEFATDAMRLAEEATKGLTALTFAKALSGDLKYTAKPHGAPTSDFQTKEGGFKFSDEQAKKLLDSDFMKKSIPDYAYNRATASNEYYKNVQKKVKAFMESYADLVKPERYVFSNVNPRNIAEMNIRFQAYLEKKKQLIEKGVKLVYVPAHSNCSKRCEPFQGKVYSLDGTSGTQDGRSFKPIEDAAENVTCVGKISGKVYQCGLFSYNCRHNLEPYQEGQHIDVIPKDVIERQRKIETEQRAMERDIRKIREKILLYDTVYKASGKKEKNLGKQLSAMRKKSANMTKAYNAYCERNNIPRYSERLQVVSGENIYRRSKEGQRDQTLLKLHDNTVEPARPTDTKLIDISP